MKRGSHVHLFSKNNNLPLVLNVSPRAHTSSLAMPLHTMSLWRHGPWAFKSIYMSPCCGPPARLTPVKWQIEINLDRFLNSFLFLTIPQIKIGHGRRCFAKNRYGNAVLHACDAVWSVRQHRTGQRNRDELSRAIVPRLRPLHGNCPERCLLCANDCLNTRFNLCNKDSIDTAKCPI